MSRARNLRRRRPAGVIVDEYVPPTLTLADRIPAPEQQPAPLSAWEQEKLRQAYGVASLRARWVAVR